MALLGGRPPRGVERIHPALSGGVGWGRGLLLKTADPSVVTSQGPCCKKMPGQTRSPERGK